MGVEDELRLCVGEDRAAGAEDGGAAALGAATFGRTGLLLDPRLTPPNKASNV